MGSPDGRPTRVRYGVMGYLCSLAYILYIDRICIGQAFASASRAPRQARISPANNSGAVHARRHRARAEHAAGTNAAGALPAYCGGIGPAWPRLVLDVED